VLIITRTLPRKRSPLINTAWTTAIMVLGDYSGVISINYPHNVSEREFSNRVAECIRPKS
jgi:hypothetical protein